MKLLCLWERMKEVYKVYQLKTPKALFLHIRMGYFLFYTTSSSPSAQLFCSNNTFMLIIRWHCVVFSTIKPSWKAPFHYIKLQWKWSEYKYKYLLICLYFPTFVAIFGNSTLLNMKRFNDTFYYHTTTGLLTFSTQL